MMGVWFLSVALGTMIVSRLAGYFPSRDPGAMGEGYAIIATVLLGTGLILFALSRWVDRRASPLKETC